MITEWAEVEQALGPAFIVDALDFSNTRRQRAYWTNIQLPTDFAKHPKPLNPDECMDAGRKVYRYEQDDGRHYVRTIGKSWRGDPDSPVADTRLPVLVRDEQHEQPQHLRPHEAERLMGMPANITQGYGITAKQRL